MLVGCGKPSTPGKKTLLIPTPDELTYSKEDLAPQTDTPPSSSDPDPRLSFPVLSGEYILAVSPSFLKNAPLSLEQDAADSLHNLVLAPEDGENGWGWAWDVLRAMAPELRSAYLDQAASVTPVWAWSYLDPILQNPAWGVDVQQALWRRLMDLPLEAQLSRILLIARNPAHPCRDQADSLLQAYYPDVQPGHYEHYQARILSGAHP